MPRLRSLLGTSLAVALIVACGSTKATVQLDSTAPAATTAPTVVLATSTVSTTIETAPTTPLTTPSSAAQTSVPAALAVDAAAAQITALLSRDAVPIGTSVTASTPVAFDTCPFGDRQSLGVGSHAPTDYSTIDAFATWQGKVVVNNGVTSGFLDCTATDNATTFELAAGTYPSCDSTVVTALPGAVATGKASGGTTYALPAPQSIIAAWCFGDFLVDLRLTIPTTLTLPDPQSAGDWLDALVPAVIAGAAAINPDAFPAHA
jgi:hypothetical protein